MRDIYAIAKQTDGDVKAFWAVLGNMEARLFAMFEIGDVCPHYYVTPPNIHARHIGVTSDTSAKIPMLVLVVRLVNNQRELYEFRFNGLINMDAKQDEVRCPLHPQRPPLSPGQQILPT